jgi:hypothetical protein
VKNLNALSTGRILQKDGRDLPPSGASRSVTDVKNIVDGDL